MEFYVVVQTLKHWHHYLVHRGFVLCTNYSTLKHLNSQDKLSHWHTMWTTLLQQFIFVVKYTSGESNKLVNALC